MKGHCILYICKVDIKLNCYLHFMHAAQISVKHEEKNICNIVANDLITALTMRVISTLCVNKF